MGRRSFVCLALALLKIIVLASLSTYGARTFHRTEPPGSIVSVVLLKAYLAKNARNVAVGDYSNEFLRSSRHIQLFASIRSEDLNNAICYTLYIFNIGIGSSEGGGLPIVEEIISLIRSLGPSIVLTYNKITEKNTRIILSRKERLKIK